MKRERTNKNLERYIYIAILCAHGVIIGLIERSIPSPFVFAPGAKIGLPNSITLLSLFTLNFRDSLALVLIRLVLTTLIGGTVSTFMYAFSGAMLSFFSMYLIKKTTPKIYQFHWYLSCWRHHAQCWPTGHRQFNCTELQCDAVLTGSCSHGNFSRYCSGNSGQLSLETR